MWFFHFFTDSNVSFRRQHITCTFYILSHFLSHSSITTILSSNDISPKGVWGALDFSHFFSGTQHLHEGQQRLRHSLDTTDPSLSRPCHPPAHFLPRHSSPRLQVSLLHSQITVPNFFFSSSYPHSVSLPQAPRPLSTGHHPYTSWIVLLIIVIRLSGSFGLLAITWFLTTFSVSYDNSSMLYKTVHNFGYLSSTTKKYRWAKFSPSTSVSVSHILTRCSQNRVLDEIILRERHTKHGYSTQRLPLNTSSRLRGTQVQGRRASSLHHLALTGGPDRLPVWGLAASPPQV